LKKVFLFAFVLSRTSAVTSLEASSIEFAYTSLERLVVSSLFTEGGRLYLNGDPGDTCNYAFVQEPRVFAEGERLHVRMLFAGSAGKMVRGKCVGSGDNFDVVVSGVPRYGNGELYLDDMKLEAESRLFDLFSPLIESQLAPRLRVPLRRSLEYRFAEWTSHGAGRLALDELNVSEITLGDESVIVAVDFGVAVTP
jgi:hypothetical protein